MTAPNLRDRFAVELRDALITEDHVLHDAVVFESDDPLVASYIDIGRVDFRELADKLIPCLASLVGRGGEP